MDGQSDQHTNELIDNVYKPTTTSYDYIKNKGLKKYKHELQHLLPFRSKKSSGKEMPVDNANCFEFVYFSWMTPIVWRSYRKRLKRTDTYQCSILDSSRVNSARIANIWDEECHKRGLHNASLQKVINRFIKTRLLFSSLFYLICLISGYLSSTLFLKMLLDHIEDEGSPMTEGVRWAVALFACELIRASSFAIMYAISIRTAIRTSSGLSTLLFNKLLTSRSINKPVGEMVNLFANDTSKIFHMVYIFPLTIGGPIVTIVTIVYTWWLLGVFALVGVLVFILIFGLQFLIAKAQSYYRKKVVQKTDERISSMTELLTFIKLIKLYAWERPFSDTIIEYRKKERILLEKCQYLQCLSTSLALMTPMVITIATILAYTMSRQGDLTAAKAFTLVMVNYVAAHGIRSLPIYLRDIVNGRIALKRIERILQYDDKDNYIMLCVNPLNCVELKKATLAWDSYSPINKSNDNTLNSRNSDLGSNADTQSRESAVQRSSTLSSTCLYDINIEIPKGKLIGITGSVGSGKTALLRSILGQMRLVNGKVGVRGSTAFVSQEPWILNASVRENIVFGYSFHNKRFYEAINCCGLTNDISSLPASDQTEVGERGVNLSGGQKQRISLARAYYADKDIYLLDDPLSSVDRTVGKHIFNQCIRGALKEKTVFLVTHQVEYLEAMDLILFMRDGKIAKKGLHKDLYNEDEEYKQLVELSKVDLVNSEEVTVRNKTNQENIDMDEVRFSSPDWGDVKPLTLSKSSSESSLSEVIDMEFREKPDSTGTFLSGRLILDEKLGKGNISLDTYNTYIEAGGGIFICAFVILWLVFQAIASSFANWWLGYWISQGNGTVASTGPDGMHGHDIILNNPDLKFYQTIYGLSIGVVLCATLALGYMFTKVTLTASSYLHDQVFAKIFKSPMSFFDTVPIGRILNIFTRDMDEIDTQVPTALDGFFQRLMLVICNLVIIIIIFPWFLFPFTAMAVVFWFVHNMFRGAMRDLKRFENASRSPIYSHITATIEGLSVIKAFNKQSDFINKFTELIDFQSAPNFLYYCSMRWLSTRMDILCVFVSLFAALFAISGKESVGAAFAGLALVLSMQLSGLLQFVIRLGVDAETRFTSVERIDLYIQTLKPEQDIITQNNISELSDWPTRGRISFREVTMRYRPGLPLALKNITFDISPQEKIGIVGKTGAGKSSITTVLFRLVDISSGSIHIDGTDISNVSLDDLRSRISIIPQDPVLFRGSIRKNLDPFNQYKIQQIMDALECVNLKEKVNSFTNGINNSVSESCTKFSAGERQLLCMARALLRKSKILVLDEATSSMDNETDKTINEAILKVFKECTVLKIAHRLQTVQDCDRVMVMQDGKIAEFDKPSTLMSNPQSLFAQMIALNHN